MKATDILQDEHRVIEQVLNCLEILADHCETEGKLDKTSALEALDFLRNFADRCHHGKEEGYLFPMLESRGFPRQGGPTGVMLLEHEVGRRLIAEMSRKVDEGAPQEFARYARNYIAVLREHIRKEDQRLFPMAATVLNAVDEETLVRQFEHAEVAEAGQGMHEHYLQLANDLADRLDAGRVSPPLARCCCHHTPA
jgi:hemerythrin-like domain-containing protein